MGIKIFQIRMTYDFNKIESYWQNYWANNKTFEASNDSDKPKYYVLDMFPYPSGAGLHVGHPLGYIASDIYARYKRHKGFNVLHPQGYDSFGLPAEQYAIQTGQHPAITTEENIKTYRRQLDRIGFSFDWSREVRTSDPNYYRWTQWIFIQLFDSWYNKKTDKAESISELKTLFSSEGNAYVEAECDDDVSIFTAEEWNNYTDEEQQAILPKYRLTYLAETEVNWCPFLGTVLANDEIVNGVSERGGHPVVRKKMTQWSMRISAYAERLLQGLETIDWTESLKESQRNWIGKSVGAEVFFPILSFPEGEGKAGGSYSQGNSRYSPEMNLGYMTGGNNSHLLIEKAQFMRANPTKAESALWAQLRNKQLEDKFRQQHLIDNYIVDFVCLSKKLIIEVDGSVHDSQMDADVLRTKNLEQKGYKVLRFKNEEVLGDIDTVINTIRKELEKLKSHQVTSPSPLERVGVRIFTTRPDTIFGVSFMTLAPEHDLVSKITTDDQKAEVEAYVEATAKRSERDRMADVKTISGAFTGAYAEHPFTKEPIPIWIGDYVLAGYGTGAVMSVPCGDQRDYDFAKHFNIPIPNIFEGVDISEEAYSEKDDTLITNSEFLNGLSYKSATKKVIEKLEEIGQGKGKINYRLRDAVFSRQRYWGEPFPVYYVKGMPQMIEKEHLPIRLPEVEKYLPTEEGEPPLGRADVWAWNTESNEVVSNEDIDHKTVFPLELNTMPGWAGSSWYFFRYMEKEKRDEVFVSDEALNYWKDVDLYIGGSEHATGHLLYSRFWVKFLKDRGFVKVDEPFKKLINQGMILGEGAFIEQLDYNPNLNNLDLTSEEKELALKIWREFRPYAMLSYDEDFQFKSFNDHMKTSDVFSKIKKDYLDKVGKIIQLPDDIQLNCWGLKIMRIDVNDLFLGTNFLNIKKFEQELSKRGMNFAVFVDLKAKIATKFSCNREVEKMSKSKYNVVNPDAICEQYGADSLRLYEMFLGPLEQAKPWNTAGITGVHGFLKKLWKLYVDDSGLKVTGEEPSKDSLKTLHKTIKKVEEDIENFSFNTSVSTFMIAVNELTSQKCNSREILEPLLIVLSPYAPHISEELWNRLGHDSSISTAKFPEFDEKHLIESNKTYPISFNGKMRFTLDLPLDLSKEELEATVMAHEKTQEQLQGRTPNRVIVIPGKIVNIVG